MACQKQKPDSEEESDILFLRGIEDIFPAIAMQLAPPSKNIPFGTKIKLRRDSAVLFPSSNENEQSDESAQSINDIKKKVTNSN